MAKASSKKVQSLILLAAVLLLVNNAAAAPAGGFLGSWELISQNAGISAMHTQLLPKTDHIAVFDASVWHISRLQLPQEKRPCFWHHNKLTNQTAEDCWCHSIFYDYNKNAVKALKVQSDTWCSSGGLSPDGRLVSTGGFQYGAKAIRYLWGCDTCDWVEYPEGLAEPRWYSTQVMLSDGSFLVYGGRDAFSYEYVPVENESNKAAIAFPFLFETQDFLERPGNPKGRFRLENNLYPFVYLLPDGNVYVFANNRSVVHDPKANKIIREFPQLPGGARSYPATGTSVLLPLYLPRDTNKPVDAEVLICGGSVREGLYLGEEEKRFVNALDDCARMVVTSPNPEWKIEKMPAPRTMADGVLLPNGEVLIINGADLGSGGWHCADKPSLKPMLYRPNAPEGQRFAELAPTDIPRMYHSVANLLPDGKVFVGGSNDNDGYFEFAKFPTELRLEKFTPPYLAPEYAALRPAILEDQSDKAATYGKWVYLRVKSSVPLTINYVQVSIVAPPFVTHGISMNQRMLFLSVIELKNNVAPGVDEVVVAAPPTSALAPPGYYLLSVVNQGIPSHSIWFHLK
ncbi:hypothetical protein AB3S75_019357 [Citrus x aurantiifolia]